MRPVGDVIIHLRALDLMVRYSETGQILCVFCGRWDKSPDVPVEVWRFGEPNSCGFCAEEVMEAASRGVGLRDHWHEKLAIFVLAQGHDLDALREELWVAEDGDDD